MQQPLAAVPQYLNDTYWWAYVHPRAVRLFERQWLVNLILWGNFARLRDAALDELGAELPGRSLQVACVYGDFTQRVWQRVALGQGSLDVVDVLPVQLSNLQRKLDKSAPVGLILRDAADLGFASDSYDRVILFFLLHEMPLDVRRRTLAEAVRVLKPGQELVIVDYHRPVAWHPLKIVMTFILRNFEPFAMDLWNHEVAEWLPDGASVAHKETFWGGLYQKLVIRK